MVPVTVLLSLLFGALARGTSAQELQDAVRNSVPHILITEHLDLRMLAPMRITEDGDVKLVIQGGTRSITVRSLLPAQC